MASLLPRKCVLTLLLFNFFFLFNIPLNISSWLGPYFLKLLYFRFELIKLHVEISFFILLILEATQDQLLILSIEFLKLLFILVSRE